MGFFSMREGGILTKTGGRGGKIGICPFIKVSQTMTMTRNRAIEIFYACSNPTLEEFLLKVSEGGVNKNCWSEGGHFVGDLCNEYWSFVLFLSSHREYGICCEDHLIFIFWLFLPIFHLLLFIWILLKLFNIVFNSLSFFSEISLLVICHTLSLSCPALTHTTDISSNFF